MSLSAKIGLPWPYNADFYNRFYLIFMKNWINHCIEGTGGITQFRPTPYLDEGADWKSCARGAQLRVTQRSTQTSCRKRGAGGLRNLQCINCLRATAKQNTLDRFLQIHPRCRVSFLVYGVQPMPKVWQSPQSTAQ